MVSALYEGTVWHDRREPTRHRFNRPWSAPLIDLRELDEVMARSRLWSTHFGPVWFRRADYHGDPAVPLTVAVADTVHRKLGRRPSTHIELLAQVRTFGWCANPIAVYWCYDEADALDAVMLEVTNTPWHERHTYVLDRHDAVVSPDGTQSWSFDKAMHVSPFLAMDYRYDLTLTRANGALRLRLDVRGRDPIGHQGVGSDGIALSAGIEAVALPLDAAHMRADLWRHPLQPLTVSAGIYAHAARLWRKRVPVHPHAPTTREAAAPEVRS
jgi:DUF1365 family protein